MPLLYADLACRDAVELATDYLDGALSWRRRRSYERHLRSCPHCSAHLAQIRAMVTALGKVEADALSPREREVLEHMAHGMKNRDIARAMWLSESTVKTHVGNVIRKLGECDRTQAVLHAIRSGMVALDR